MDYIYEENETCPDDTYGQDETCEDNTYGQNESNTERIGSNLQEISKCIGRDWYSCVLTGMPCQDVCYIVPYMISAAEEDMDQDSRTYFNYIMSLFSGQSLDELTNLGSCDNYWNMLCMDPVLHYWWGECLFGLKCVGVNSIPNDDNCIIQLQFHWMHRNDLYPEQYVAPLDITIHKMLQHCPEEHTGLLSNECFARLKTGQIFYIVIPEKDAYKMKTMIDIRWANTKLAMLSGATGTWDVLKAPPGELIPRVEHDRVEAWIRNLPASTREYEPI